MALGCSTNTVLHLPAIAHEAGITLALDDIQAISERTPQLCKLAPAGADHIEDLAAAGGVRGGAQTAGGKDLVDTGCLTVSGRTIGEQLAEAKILDENVIRPLPIPYSTTGGIAVLWGNLAPNGAVVKQGAVAPEMMQKQGRPGFQLREEAVCSYLWQQNQGGRCYCDPL